ncbi:MAG: YdcF family protein [Erysipelotrichaceae bacterium]|nr:YdcF family protein [Erysipelotrichaceae bacterium]MBQ9840508.1 YdcF family protein [Erysipelotrichaceae bacterium]
MKRLQTICNIIAVLYLIFHLCYAGFMFTQSLFYAMIWLAILVVEVLIVVFGLKKAKFIVCIFTLFLLAQSCLSAFIYVKGFDLQTKNADYVVVLGYALEDNQMTETLKLRLDRTYEYAIDNPNANIVLCGGITGSNTVSEAKVMYDYLVTKGIVSTRMRLEDTSTDTIENIQNCKSYIDTKSKVVVLSSNYHVYRASKICEKAGFEVHTLGSKAPILLLPNQFLHEKLGFIKMMIFM